MGMNMVSKGVEDVLGYLQNDFPDMDLISLSGLVLPFDLLHSLRSFLFAAF
jgi:hypothetical protein